MPKSRLHFEDVECRKPQPAHGDLIFLPDTIVFLAFPKKSALHSPLSLFLGVILVFFSFIRRAGAMNNWRDQWRDKDPRDVVGACPQDWKLDRQEVLEINHRLIKLEVKTTRPEPYLLTLGYPQWHEIQEFGKAHGWTCK